MSISDWATLLGVVVSLSLLLNGLFQYAKSQRWKRAEFLAHEMKEFESKPRVRNVMTMLDWTARKIELFPDREGEQKWETVTDNIVAKALEYHGSRKPQLYSAVEVAIRDSFDDFLDGLERMDTFLKSGLVSVKDLKPYLKYWIDIIGDPEDKRKSKNARDQIWSYLENYGYQGVRDLIRRYGWLMRDAGQVDGDRSVQSPSA